MNFFHPCLVNLLAIESTEQEPVVVAASTNDQMGTVKEVGLLVATGGGSSLKGVYNTIHKEKGQIVPAVDSG